MSDVNREAGMAIYESICNVLDEMKVKYEKVQDDLALLFGYRGDDMNHELLIVVNINQEVIELVEKLPFNIDKERANDIAAAISYVNYEDVLLGKFTYNMDERLAFEMSQIYSESLISEETLRRMIINLVLTVEEYDDKFMALNKGYLKPEDFKKEKA